MKAVSDALIALFTADATFTAALQALNLGSTGSNAIPQVIKGNRPWTSLGQEKFPAWVVEAGDADPAPLSDGADGEGLVIGSTQQSFKMTLLVALVWHQQNPDTAFEQRLDLLAAMASLLLRIVPPAGCTNWWVAGFKNDRQANHPTHVASFALAAEITCSR
jgi:hypothetical protein